MSLLLAVCAWRGSRASCYVCASIHRCRPRHALRLASAAGDGPHAEVAVIHTLGMVPGARVLLPPAAARNGSGLYEGGSLADVIAAASAASAPPGARIALYHGVCAWAEGQLEGELRSGAWGMCPASLADVHATPPDRLWADLSAQPGRLRWLRGRARR